MSIVELISYLHFLFVAKSDIGSFVHEVDPNDGLILSCARRLAFCVCVLVKLFFGRDGRHD